MANPHFVVVALADQMLSDMGSDGVAKFLLVFAVTIAAMTPLAYYRYIEKQFMSFGRKLTHAVTARRAAP